MAVRRGVWAITSLAVPGWALAAPQGGQVVAGSASIAQQGTKTTITQSTAKSAIDWQSFSIGTNEYVQFVQPGTTSVTLNRVVGNDPSQLLGQMSANGQIFLVNPNGVYFGPNAVIDVAGLLATTFGISNDDFMTGRYTFARVEGRDPATVVNDGTINADGGYVILAGDGVANHGLIEAHLGDIVMASGQQVTLDLGGDGLISFAIDGEALTEIAGVENTGELYADGGRIFLTAKVQGDLLPTAVNHEGLIQARTVEERDGIVYLGQ
jgi:filamentous hemagglutinin family protein